MKRMVALAMVAVMMICAAAGYAETGKGRTLREGKYIVGEDIAAGTYTLTCIETAGEQLSDAYGSLGSMLDSMGDDQGYGSMFGAFGDMFEAYVGMTVEILGAYGDVLKSYTMKAGDSMSIKLKNDTALAISDGSCTLVAER